MRLHRRSGRLLGIALAAGLLGGLGGVARAYTGGSGGGHGGHSGGGGWGGGGHSYGGSRSRGGSRGGSIGGSDRRPDPATRRRLRRRMLVLWGCCAVGAGALLYLLFRPGGLERIFTRRDRAPGWGPAVPRHLHLETLTIGLDWHARPAVQRTLDELTASSRLGDPGARARALSRLSHLLLSHQVSWLYAACQHDVVTGRAAPAEFSRADWRARSRFTHERVRNDNGEVTLSPGAPVPARARDGQGVIVVSVVTATRPALWPVASAADPHAVRRSLEQRTLLTGGDVWALGFAWCPADGAERMSSAAAEALYPELRLLDEAAMVGRVFCASCQGPYGLELGACPHCAAATEADTRATRQPAGAAFAPTGPGPGDARAHLECAYCSARFAPEQLSCPGCARPAEPATQARRGAGAA